MRAVVAIGGNSLIKDASRQKVEDQYRAIVETCSYIADIVEQGHQVVVTHGNGPQVGFILRRSEIAYQHEGLHFVPLVSCVADTQGAIGYQIQQALNNEFAKRKIPQKAATIVTRVKVSLEDKSFLYPSKPIGAFYTEKQADEITNTHPDWNLVYDSGRGYRRVVPSPEPIEIVELDAIKTLFDSGLCVIAAGGGGIPVAEKEGYLEGVDAVIDKDKASQILASALKADILIISTSVDKVSLNFGKPNESPIYKMTLDQAELYLNQGHFAPGSMRPKIEAAIRFIKNKGKKVIITKPEDIAEALKGEKGTHIVERNI